MPWTDLFERADAHGVRTSEILEALRERRDRD